MMECLSLLDFKNRAHVESFSECVGDFVFVFVFVIVIVFVFVSVYVFLSEFG